MPQLKQICRAWELVLPTFQVEVNLKASVQDFQAALKFERLPTVRAGRVTRAHLLTEVEAGRRLSRADDVWAHTSDPATGDFLFCACFQGPLRRGPSSRSRVETWAY